MTGITQIHLEDAICRGKWYWPSLEGRARA